MAINASLKQSFEQAALDIFDAMVEQGDGEYYQQASDYDKRTGAITNTGAVSVVRMARVNLDRKENLPDGVTTEDTKFIIIQEELPVPVTEAGLISYANIVYTINRIDVDPADVLWFVYGRKK